MSEPSLADLTRTERLALIAQLEALTTQHWETPSLCQGWRVVDVAAHLAWAPVLGPVEGGAALLRNRLSLNRMIARSAVEWSGRGTDAILDQLRTNAESGAKPIGMPQVAALSDAVVHGLDIRRPLGLQHPVPPASVAPLADFALVTPWPLAAVIGGSARRRVRGVRLVVTDADWQHGDGPEVRLSADAALRLVYGRPVEPAELDGPGVPLLAPRLG